MCFLRAATDCWHNFASRLTSMITYDELLKRWRVFEPCIIQLYVSRWAKAALEGIEARDKKIVDLTSQRDALRSEADK